MASIKCRACGYAISAESTGCPKCGGTPKKPMGRLQLIAIIIFGGFVLNSIFPSSTPTTPAKADAALVTANAAGSSAEVPRSFREPKPSLTEAERTRLLATATKSLKRKRDKIEKTTFFMAQNDGLRTQVGAYFGLADGGSPYLRMKTVYYGDSWVFYDAVKIMADDEIVYEKAFNRRDISRDNEGGSVWEVADYLATPSDQAALGKISGAKSVTVRFAGRDRTRDHLMTAAERSGLKSVLAAYAELKQKL